MTTQPAEVSAADPREPEIAAPEVPAEYADGGEESAPTKRSYLQGLGGFAPVLVSLPAGLIGLVGTVVGVLLPPHGLGMSYCGMQRTMGVPCPGCGLTRSVSCFLQGEFSHSFSYHPFGFVFAILFVALALTLLLPRRIKEPLAGYLAAREKKIGIAFLCFCVLLLLYGIFRIVMIKAGHPDFVWWAHNGEVLPPFVQGE